jgi:hypothetical protein
MTALSWALSRATRGMPHERRLVLAFLAAHADRDGWVFVSNATLAEEVALSERTVQVAVREAIEQSWLGERQCDCPVPAAYEAIQRNRRPRLLCFLGCHQHHLNGVKPASPHWGEPSSTPEDTGSGDVIDLFHRAQGGRTA